MDNTDKKVYELQFALRKAVNASGLPLSVVEAILDGIRGEVMNARRNEMVLNLLKGEKNDTTEKKETETENEKEV